MDDVTHQLFRRLSKERRGDTRVLGGTVREVSPDGQFVKVGFAGDAESAGIEPVWTRADGVTAVGAEVATQIGTDGRPMGATTTLIPNGATEEYVGPTGKRILGQKLELDVQTERIDEFHDRIEGMEWAIVDAEQYLPVSDDEPTEAETAPVGAIWRQVDGDGHVIGKWIRTESGWEPFTGAVVQAETVAAAVGVFIDAMMENLTVTGAANISEAAIGELTARVANIIRVHAEQVIVGRDIRFWSGGLAFYAPPVAGQSPTDWANRTPIIAITPTGDTSIAVAAGGLVTAGITPQGGVWGKTGAFDTLAVGGRDIMALLRDLPRGVLARTRLMANTSLTVAYRRIFGVRVELHTGRTYRLMWHSGVSVDAGAVTILPRLRWGTSGTTVDLNEVPVYRTADNSFVAQFTASEVGFPEGAPVEVILIGKTASGTGTFWSGAWMTLEDIGPEVVAYKAYPENPDTPPPAPPAPTVTEYGPELVYSGAAWGVRPNGSNAVDGRLTVGGYNVYGTDMAEWVLFPIDFNRLSGSTVRGASVVLNFTANAPVAFRLDAGTGPNSGHVNVFNGTAGTTGNIAYEIPASLVNQLRGKTCLIVKPFYPGSQASYGVMASGAAIWLRYAK